MHDETKRGATESRMPDDVEHPGDRTERRTDPLRNKQAAKHQTQRVFDPVEGIPHGNHEIGSLPLDSSRLFEQALEQTRMAIALTDPHAPDNPLIYVNKAFEVMTGYDRREAIGRNCRFLQTRNTSQVELERLRRAMANEETVVVELENQRKDGSVFINALHVGPIYDARGQLTNFYGSQWNISELVRKRAEVVEREVVATEMRHRIGNLFTVVSSIVRLSARNETDVQMAIAKANDRILALARAHEVTTLGPGRTGDPARIHDLVETIIKPYRLRAEGRMVIGGHPTELPTHAVTPVGLALHELATNSVKYGALRAATGRVSIEWTALDDMLYIVWEEQGGKTVTETRDGSGTGTRILEGVMASVGGTITFHWRSKGVKVSISLPLNSL